MIILQIHISYETLKFNTLKKYIITNDFVIIKGCVSFIVFYRIKLLK